MSSIEENLLKVRADIKLAESTYHRRPNSVVLLAATKGHTIDEMRDAYDAGQLEFGESYVQEALPKIMALNAYSKKVIWHYIGRIQTNKVKLLAENFHWVQSVTNIKQAKLLSQHRAQIVEPLNICLEINLSHEASKTGIDVDIDEILTLAKAVAILPRIKLRGLMAIPAPQSTFDAQFATFSKLKEIYDKLNANGLALDTLSMGMSGDFVAAIAAGATMIRIGTAIFGARAARA